jgi:hypothetical protein
MRMLQKFPRVCRHGVCDGYLRLNLACDYNRGGGESAQSVVVRRKAR